MKLIGIDCAAAARNTGLALGYYSDGQILLSRVTVASVNHPPAQIVSGWLADSLPTILAFDAPLGWPMQMGEELSGHSAGQFLEVDEKHFFCRLTDRIVEEQLGKRPLEVGANLIARTALAALRLLNDLRRISGQAIPLDWIGEETDQITAIEVYPAATLVSCREAILGFHRKNSTDRLEMLYNLGITVDNEEDTDLIRRDLNAFDAVVCLRSAADFLQGNCIRVTDVERALREGWIWVKESGS